MKVKVRKKATHQYHNNSNWASRSNSQTSTTTTQNGSKTGSGTDDAKKKDNSEKNSVQVVNENEPISDFFQRDEEVREEFGFNELMIFASLDKFEDVVEELEGYGLSDCFTMKDVERIIRVSRALALKVYGGLK
jgi:hypothetical protein